MLVYNIVTNNIFFYLGSQKDIARIDVWMLYLKYTYMTVWDHTTSKGLNGVLISPSLLVYGVFMGPRYI